MEFLVFKLIFWLAGLVFGLIFAREAYFIAKMNKETRRYLIHRFVTAPEFWLYNVLIVLLVSLAIWFYNLVASSNLAITSAV